MNSGHVYESSTQDFSLKKLPIPDSNTALTQDSSLPCPVPKKRKSLHLSHTDFMLVANQLHNACQHQPKFGSIVSAMML